MGGLGLEESLRLTVAALMQATGESQRELAVVLGLTQTQVSRRQAGTTAWSLRDCEILAAHYGIGPLDLLAGPTRACEARALRTGENVTATESVNENVNVKDGVAGR
ncbi:helix-turn-helix domain-containing protein [Streptomyces sp. NPDC058301]|uniref:helix-turn-helix domain-containing protein n=1 Tax=Streptomyces sp. NPDC058301 TaxID=3346436 RepID=UPI0036E4A8EE